MNSLIRAGALSCALAMPLAGCQSLPLAVSSNGQATTVVITSQPLAEKVGQAQSVAALVCPGAVITDAILTQAKAKPAATVDAIATAICQFGGAR